MCSVQSIKVKGSNIWCTPYIFSYMNFQLSRLLVCQRFQLLEVLLLSLKCHRCRSKVLFNYSLVLDIFIYLGFYIAFNTVQVISRRVVGRAEETKLEGHRKPVHTVGQGSEL